jgi:hypothetical protein
MFTLIDLKIAHIAGRPRSSLEALGVGQIPYAVKSYETIVINLDQIGLIATFQEASKHNDTQFVSANPIEYPDICMVTVGKEIYYVEMSMYQLKNYLINAAG